MLRVFEIDRNCGNWVVTLEDFKKNVQAMDYAFEQGGFEDYADYKSEKFNKYVEDNWQEIIDEMKDEDFVEMFYPDGLEGFEEHLRMVADYEYMYNVKDDED